MPNIDDEGNQNIGGPYSPSNNGLRNRMRFQEALHSELTNNVNWLMQSEQDLLKIFRFYILVLGAFISALSLLVTQGNGGVKLSELINFYTVSAGVFWAIAVLGTVVAYAVIQCALGIDRLHHDTERHTRNVLLGEKKKEVFDILDLNEKLDDKPRKFEEEIIHNYIQSIHHTEEQFDRFRYPLLWGGMLLIPIAVLVFGVGILAPLSGVEPSPIQAGSLRLSEQIHQIGVVALFCGGIVSAFLILQMLALWGRFLRKIMVSAVADLIPGEWESRRP